MADATVRADFVPASRDRQFGNPGGNDTPGPTADLAAVVADVANVDSVVVDRGKDLVTSLDVVAKHATTATAVAAITAIEELTSDDVFDDDNDELVLQRVGNVRIEEDPVLNEPANLTLNIADANVEIRTYEVTLSPGAKIASVGFDENEIPSGAVTIVTGDPQGHDSQKTSDNKIVLAFGPAVSGDTAGSPHDVTIEVTDSNGRSAQDTIVVTVVAGT